MGYPGWEGPLVRPQTNTADTVSWRPLNRGHLKTDGVVVGVVEAEILASHTRRGKRARCPAFRERPLLNSPLADASNFCPLSPEEVTRYPKTSRGKMRGWTQGAQNPFFKRKAIGPNQERYFLISASLIPRGRQAAETVKCSSS
jgi:hypothetical protein